jgi:predicted aminopeptidase
LGAAVKNLLQNPDLGTGKMKPKLQIYKSALSDFSLWLRVGLNFVLLAAFAFGTTGYKMGVYLAAQGWGEIRIITGTVGISEFSKQANLGETEKQNLSLIPMIKSWAVDSFGFDPSSSYSRVFDQKGKPLLWTVTGSETWAIQPYEWNFPLLGKTDYKGFFSKQAAMQEHNRLLAEGYDAEIRKVSAWSTLGWLPDPLLSETLKRKRGSFCNLIFHELFHGTCYIPGHTSLNENLASFVAHISTCRFLARDTSSLRIYLNQVHDSGIFRNYVLRKTRFLRAFYAAAGKRNDNMLVKLKFLQQISDSIDLLPLLSPGKFSAEKEEILRSKNAYFTGFGQYEQMQDSLENVFNNIYRGDLKKMVRHLRANKFIH